MFTLRSDGRYMGYYRDDGGRHSAYERDPEELYARIQELEKPKVLTFGEVAEEWKENHWKKIGLGTQSGYNSPFNQIIADHGKFAIEDITAAEINRVMLREQSKDMSYQHASTVRSMYKLTFNYAIVKAIQALTLLWW